MAERRGFLALIASLVGFAWMALWIWGRSPYGRYLNHQQLGELGAGALFLPITFYLVGWTLMTIAMMLPTALPLLETFRRLTAPREDRSKLIGLVIGGYLGIWIGFGIAAHTADWLLHEIVERSSWLEARAWLIGAATLMIAGGFQFSRMKYRCLEKCRAPLTFVTEYWRGRHERRNAFFSGNASWTFLRRLLLGADAFDVRRRGWQRGLDAWAWSRNGRRKESLLGS
jgi:predicted metal-binding membrane protein